MVVAVTPRMDVLDDALVLGGAAQSLAGARCGRGLGGSNPYRHGGAST